ncbi:MAG TPA: SRPBCC domain-containing protein [Caulobacteraceae bacterium]|jgi:uncharacterized protein YndB with AHSA1/START domain
MKHQILALGLGLIIAGPALAQATATATAVKSPDVVDTSFTTADGQRDLQQSIVIDAPVAVLWRSFTDAVEFKRWNAPVAAIDMRVGGSLEASYNTRHAIGDPDNIKHRVITFLPERLIVFQNIQAPRMLPGAAAFQRTVIVLQFEPLGPARTKVTLSCTGWGTDAASNRLYAFFQRDNAEELESWKHVYETKPAGG